MAEQHYDAIVIGAGQAGVPLATALAKARSKTVLVERSTWAAPASTRAAPPPRRWSPAQGGLLRPPLH
jgi:cation diffusion facilitator CzcD-associated flavoprotein CzcO